MKKFKLLFPTVALTVFSSVHAQQAVSPKEMGNPVQTLAPSQELKDFVNRYAKAAAGRGCRTFEQFRGGLVFASPRLRGVTAETYFQQMNMEIQQMGKAGSGVAPFNTMKVFLDKPKNVVAMTAVDPQSGPFLTVMQIRGERLMVTGCPL